MTFPADNPFIPDSPTWDGAVVVISQPSPTNLICASLSPNGLAVTNSIAIDGRHWWWSGGRLEFSGTAVYPGIGFGAFLQILKTRKECVVEPSKLNDAPVLRVQFKCQVSGFMLVPFGPWHDPEEDSEILLVPQ